jgi:hypothetical protein
MVSPRIAGLLAAAILAAVQPPAPDIDLGPEDQALTRLFTPVAAPPGTYAVYRVTTPIADLAAALRARDAAPAPGAWSATRPESHDAFGQAGLYDRYRLAQLFGGRRLTVVRGSLRRQGLLRAYTLISPYPDPSLTRIESGTMVIVVTLGHEAGRL